MKIFLSLSLTVSVALNGFLLLREDNSEVQRYGVYFGEYLTESSFCDHSVEKGLQTECYFESYVSSLQRESRLPPHLPLESGRLPSLFYHEMILTLKNHGWLLNNVTIEGDVIKVNTFRVGDRRAVNMNTFMQETVSVPYIESGVFSEYLNSILDPAWNMRIVDNSIGTLAFTPLNIEKPSSPNQRVFVGSRGYAIAFLHSTTTEPLKTLFHLENIDEFGNYAPLLVIEQRAKDLASLD